MTPEELDGLRRTVATPLGEVACVDAGEGPAALFVHGAFLNAYLWAGTIGELRGERRCLAVDLPAHGRSAAAPGQDLSLVAQAELLDAVCEALGLGRVDLVGNDSGSALCQVLAARRPRRLRTLTLTNGETPYELPGDTLLPEPVVRLAREGRLAGAVARMLDDHEVARSELGIGVGFEDPSRLTGEAIRAYLGPLVATEAARRGFERCVASLDAAPLRDAVPALRESRVPTLVVWGTGDEMFGTAPARWLAENVGGVARVVELEGARLYFPAERPGELAAHLREHWAAHPE